MSLEQHKVRSGPGWWRGQSPARQAVVKQLGIALVISLALTYLSYWIVEGVAFLRPNFDARRWVALIDSVLAGVLAFAMLGIFTFLASLRRPEDEEIDHRIAFLYSARRPDGANSAIYLKDQLMRLGAVISRAEMRYTVVACNETQDQIRVVASFKLTLVNMMLRDSYSQALPLRIRLTRVEAGTSTIGTLYYVRTTPMLPNGSWGVASSFLVNPFSFTRQSLVFEASLPIQIPPGGEMVYEYMYEFWCPAEESHKAGAQLFIEDLVVSVTNTSDVEIEIAADNNPDLDARFRTINLADERSLRKSDAMQVNFKSLPPTEDIAILFRLKREHLPEND